MLPMPFPRFHMHFSQNKKNHENIHRSMIEVRSKARDEEIIEEICVCLSAAVVK